MIGKKWLIAATIVLLLIGGGFYAYHRLTQHVLNGILAEVSAEKQHCLTLPNRQAQARCVVPPIVDVKAKTFEEAYAVELGKCLGSRGYNEWRAQGNITLEQWCEQVSRFRANKIIGADKSPK